MANLIIGNIIMFIASVIMVISGAIKSKKKTVVLQTVQLSIMSIGTIFLGSIPGTIINLFSCLRNLLSYNGKLNRTAKALLIAFSVGISIAFNNLGFVGLLPVISSIMFILYMDTPNIIRFKFLMIFNACCWLVHDIYVKSYTSLVFDILTIITCIIAIIRNLSQLKAQPINWWVVLLVFIQKFVVNFGAKNIIKIH